MICCRWLIEPTDTGLQAYALPATMQETTGKKPEKTFIKISKGNVRNDIFLWMHLIRLFLTKIKDYNLKDMWFQQDGNTTLANQPLPQEKFAGCAISRC